MTLNISTGVIPSQAAVDAQIQRSIDLDPLLTPAQVAVELAAAYLEYSKEGILPGADLTPGGTQSILNTGFIIWIQRGFFIKVGTSSDPSGSSTTIAHFSFSANFSKECTL